MGKNKFKPSVNKIIKEISDVALLLWERGWAERNAGNFSINITGEFKFYVRKLNKYPVNPLESEYNYLKKNFLLISTAGSRMKDISKEPHKHILILYITESGKDYIFFSLNKDGKKVKPNSMPTSEILTHLAIQNQLSESRSELRTVLHSHPTEIIALTHLEEYTDENKLNEILFKMHPEVKLFIPEGVGLVKFMNSGNKEIANATLAAANSHRIVIWEKHGCCITGQTLSDAFELTDIITKSAKIFFLCHKKN